MPDTITQPQTLQITGQAKRKPAERKREEWLLLLSLLLLSDVDDSTAWWSQIAPPKYTGMLTGTGWTYNPGLMQWTRASNPLPSPVVKQAVVLAVTEAEATVGTLTKLMTTGGMKLDQWQDQMLSLVKRTQIAVSAVARGGIDSLPAGELGRTAENIPGDPGEVASTGDMVAYQTDRLQRFAEQIERGQDGADTADKIESRSKLYVRQAIAGYEEARRRTGAAIGVAEAINVLDSAAEHCLPSKVDPLPDCPSISRAGWMALEAMPPIGLRRCRMNCRCSLAFRLADGTELP